MKTWTLYPGRLKCGAQEGAGRPFAVGSGDVEHGGQPILRAAKPLQKFANPVQPEAIPGWRQLREPVELSLHVRVR